MFHRRAQGSGLRAKFVTARNLTLIVGDRLNFWKQEHATARRTATIHREDVAQLLNPAVRGSVYHLRKGIRVWEQDLGTVFACSEAYCIAAYEMRHFDWIKCGRGSGWSIEAGLHRQAECFAKGSKGDDLVASPGTSRGCDNQRRNQLGARRGRSVASDDRKRDQDCTITVEPYSTLSRA